MNKKSRKKSFSLLKKISYKEFKGSLLRYVITVFSCVTIIVMGTGMLAYATTSIGENIVTNILTATGLTVSGNATTTGTLNAEGGIIGDLTGNVVGNLTGTSTNAEQLGNILAADYSTDTERTNALADYMALSGGTISGNLNVSGNTVLATTSLATTTISALGSVNGNIKYVKPGETIQGVIDGITGANETNPYTIIIPPGVYVEQITMKDCVSLQGSGRNATIISVDSDVSYVAGVYLANNVSLSHLSVILTGYHTDCISSVRGDDDYNVYIDNCNLGEEGKGFSGLYLLNGGNYTITNSRIAVIETACGSFSGEYNLYSCELVKGAIESMFGVVRSTVVWQTGTASSVGRLFNCYVHAEDSVLSGSIIQVGDYYPTALFEMYNTKVYATSDYSIKGIQVGSLSNDTNGINNIYGGSIEIHGANGSKDIFINDSEGVSETNLYGTKYSTSFGVIGGKHNAEDETATGTYTLNSSGVTIIDSSAGAVTGTLGDGHYISQRKTIVMTDATNSSTVSVSHHETSDPEIGTFDAVDEVWILEWLGTEWVTIKATCTF